MTQWFCGVLYAALTQSAKNANRTDQTFGQDKRFGVLCGCSFSNHNPLATVSIYGSNRGKSYSLANWLSKDVWRCRFNGSYMGQLGYRLRSPAVASPLSRPCPHSPLSHAQRSPLPFKRCRKCDRTLTGIASRMR